MCDMRVEVAACIPDGQVGTFSLMQHVEEICSRILFIQGRSAAYTVPFSCVSDPGYLRLSYEIVVDVAARFYFDYLTLFLALIYGATMPAHAVVS